MPKTTFACRAVPSGEGASRTLRFVGSTEGVARDGGVLKMEGWQLDGYRANPVFLWGHNQDQPPIGRAVRVAPGADGLEFDIEFPTPDVYPFGDLIGRLYEAGFMKAVSVGFRVLKEREPAASERAAGAQWVSESHELLELSAVPVGADAGALMAARKACRSEDAVLLRSMGPAFEALAQDIEARPYDASGKKIEHPTEEELAAYEAEKKKKKDEARQVGEEALAAIMSRLDAVLERVNVLSSLLVADEPFDGHAQDAAGSAAEQAVEKPVERTSAPSDPYGILSKARQYSGQKE